MADKQQTNGQSAGAQRLEEAVRAAETRSAEDHAALERVRRKLTRLMLVSLVITFIALAVVAAAVIYKISRAPAPGKTEAAAQNSAQTAAAASPFIQTAPNSGAEDYFARQAKQAAAPAPAAAERKIALRPGEKLLEAQLSGALLLLRVSAPEGGAQRLIIYDFRQGKTIAAIAAGQ